MKIYTKRTGLFRISLRAFGDFENTRKFFQSVSSGKQFDPLNKYGEIGVTALAGATPIDSGKTASSWDYEIERENEKVTIVWTNSNINKNVNIAVILQYGHGTNNGGYVQGIDYINPALRPVFEDIANAVWEEVKRA